MINLMRLYGDPTAWRELYMWGVRHNDVDAIERARVHAYETDAFSDAVAQSRLIEFSNFEFLGLTIEPEHVDHIRLLTAWRVTDNVRLHESLALRKAWHLLNERANGRDISKLEAADIVWKLVREQHWTHKIYVKVMCAGLGVNSSGHRRARHVWKLRQHLDDCLLLAGANQFQTDHRRWQHRAIASVLVGIYHNFGDLV